MKFLRLFLFISILSVSCNVINKEEAIPAFINIEEYHLNPGDLGSAHHNISDAWLSVNGEFIGVFELPATIPVLTEGPATIRISPGIKNFGQANDRQDYKLIEDFVLNTTLVPEEIISLSPEINFFDSLILQPSSEDFSGTGANLIVNPGSFEIVEDPTLDSSPLTDIDVGEFISESGLLEITSDSPFSVVNLGPTFLEFDYQTNENFLVGLKTGTTDNDKTYLLGLTPKYDENGDPEWNRVYLNLEEYINFFHSTNIIAFNIFFENEVDNINTILKLDNIKVITLQP